MYGHPLSKDFERFCKEHFGKPGDPKWHGFLADFKGFLDDKLVEMSEEHDNYLPGTQTRVFGMSKAGGCTRSAALKLLGHKGEPTSGSTQATFFIGHLLECAVLALLKAVGHDVGGNSQAVAVIEPMMRSATDGVFTFFGTPTGLSVKTAGYKKSGKKPGRKGTSASDWERRGFPELPFEGVRRSQPGHWAQMQAEMKALGLTQSLYVVMSKDIIKAMEGDPYLDSKEGNGSLTFYSELVKYDPIFVEEHLLPVWEQQYDFASNGEAGPAFFISKTADVFVELNPASDQWKPNADRTGTFNPCSYCEFNAEGYRICAEVA